ncbi:glycerate kinase [Staphylococcus felis]|uniref:glycerate kinase n=1 Tax=Staphylococcus felis TaxID=46127 RepID=UPI003966C8FB
MKTILIAPDSFKECMTAMEAANAIEKGWRRVFGDTMAYIKLPMADGGEGTFQALHDALSGHIVSLSVTGPLGEKVNAHYSLVHEAHTAIIEMAQASGLDLVAPSKRNPMQTTTFGTGEMVKHALDQGVKQIILGIGGSATNDGGVGFLQALGARVVSQNKEEIGFGGGQLERIQQIDLSTLDERLRDIKIEVACDVDNPLLGENGATKVYGPQKGATREMVDKLEAGMTKYHSILSQTLGKEISKVPGAGAAGGLGAALIACTHTSLKRGIDIVLELTQFENHVKHCDLVITGEGRIDGQTLFGKTPMGVAQLAKRYQKPVIAVAGLLGSGFEQVVESNNIDAVFSISKGPTALKKALEHGIKDLEMWANQLARFYQLQL